MFRTRSRKAPRGFTITVASDVLLAMSVDSQAVAASCWRCFRLLYGDQEAARLAHQAVEVVCRHFARGGTPILTDVQLTAVLRAGLPELDELGARRAAVAMRESVQRVLRRGNFEGSA